MGWRWRCDGDGDRDGDGDVMAMGIGMAMGWGWRCDGDGDGGMAMLCVYICVRDSTVVYCQERLPREGVANRGVDEREHIVPHRQ